MCIFCVPPYGHLNHSADFRTIITLNLDFTNSREVGVGVG